MSNHDISRNGCHKLDPPEPSPVPEPRPDPPAPDIAAALRRRIRFWIVAGWLETAGEVES